MEQNKREIKFRCFATTFPNKPMAFRYFNLSRAEDNSLLFNLSKESEK